MGWDISTLQRTGILQEHTLGTAHSWNSGRSSWNSTSQYDEILNDKHRVSDRARPSSCLISVV